MKSLCVILVSWLNNAAATRKQLSTGTTECELIPSCENLRFDNQPLTITNLNELLPCARDARGRCFIRATFEQYSEPFNEGGVAVVPPFEIGGVDLGLPQGHLWYIGAGGITEDGAEIWDCEPTTGILQEEGQCVEVTDSTATLEGLLTKHCLIDNCQVVPSSAVSIAILRVWGSGEISTPPPEEGSTTAGTPLPTPTPAPSTGSHQWTTPGTLMALAIWGFIYMD
eukprot:Protomagalhaensia_wolfi_Nauph_80__2676@NODE_2808_length_981_cov_528_663482_g2205_i0_p1_GENE_NODE_2808_length_981_cov_528_663482_g2205_i0NODE_2808_length_981_cov_528_663482_g2205_i0_p1_ORF_typecomplete_len226_score32_83_NODE_2808_length_981_cov_528_663482_g2205_i052729